MTANSNRLIVLLAEDDENDAILIRRAFRRLHSAAELTLIRDGEQVLAYLRGAGNFSDRVKWPVPDLLLLDHWMPRLSGLDVLCWIRAQPRYTSLPVVILSGGFPPALARSAARLKAVCCTKGIDVTQTLRSIEQALPSALRLAQEGWSMPASGFQLPDSFCGVLAERIRVWT
jgi:CheY-like chemotaxis protein